MRRAWSIVAVAAAIALLTVPARANHMDLADPNDARGRLDILKVVPSGIVKPIREVKTQMGWTNQSIQDTGYFNIYYDTFGTPRLDYYVLVRSTGKHLDATLWRDFLNRPDRVIGAATVWRNGDRRVAIRVSLEQMRISEGRTTYSWKAKSLFFSGNCPSWCLDSAPDHGVVTEPLPEALQNPA